MIEKVQVKVIELDKTELKPGCKYIFLLDPACYNWKESMDKALQQLIGSNFVILPLQRGQLHILELLPGESE